MELFIKSYGSYKPSNRNERVRCPGQGRSSCPGLRCTSTCLPLTMVWVLLLWNRHLSYGRIGWQWNSRPLKGQEATDRSRGSPERSAEASRIERKTVRRTQKTGRPIRDQACLSVIIPLPVSSDRSGSYCTGRRILLPIRRKTAR